MTPHMHQWLHKMSQLWKWCLLPHFPFYFSTCTHTLIATTHLWQRCVFPYSPRSTHYWYPPRVRYHILLIWGTPWCTYHNISVRPWPINSRREQLREYLIQQSSRSTVHASSTWHTTINTMLVLCYIHNYIFEWLQVISVLTGVQLVDTHLLQHTLVPNKWDMESMSNYSSGQRCPMVGVEYQSMV